jgi:AcrR family transcriptional regulator
VTTQRIAPDRRADLKARHRQAILDAADALIRERGRPQFSVDELAERADVSRRTVFNHFSSLDEVVMLTCTRVISDAVEEFRAATAATPVGGSPAAVFEEIVSVVGGMDLPPVVAYLWGVLAADGEDVRTHRPLDYVFSRATEDLAADLAGRGSEDEAFEVEILVSSLMNGVAVVARQWILRTGAALDPDSRAVWDELFQRLLAAVGNGYSRTT